MHSPYVRLICCFLFLFLYAFESETASQNKGYEILPSPDIWYNDVDGIRLGVNLLGQVPGSFEDGPHRLRAGVWVGLWFPSTPLSYHLTYTEPIGRLSDFGSEASVQLLSSFRTGYHIHGAGLHKRWQRGFNERNFRELSIVNTFEKRTHFEYTPFPSLWSDESKFLTSFTFLLQNENSLGEYGIKFNSLIQYLSPVYLNHSLSIFQRADFNRYWGIRVRGFASLNGSNSGAEYLVSRSMKPAIEWMADGVTRAKGTIPQNWIESGMLHIAGGANLRGYTEQDVSLFEQCNNSDSSCNGLYHSFLALNSEFDFWNPVDALFNRNNYASEFLRFRSYFFFDAGGSPGITEEMSSKIYSNAGAGVSFSLNIPNHLGKDRGFVIRYEIPFWLSSPSGEESFSFRSLFGFGAVISI